MQNLKKRMALNTNALNIYYLLETTELCGGVRVVLDQARALTRRGHRVNVLSRRGDHSWYPYAVHVRYQPDGFSAGEEKPDIVIGTFWTTIEPALRMDARQTVHLCQGCEWTMPEYAPIRSEIEAAYDYRIPKVTLGEWLVKQISDKFGRNAFPVIDVGQTVDLQIFRRPSWYRRICRFLKRPPYNVLIVGMYGPWVKGISVALDAVAQLRNDGVSIRLIRVTTTDTCSMESAITAVDEFHMNVPVLQMPSIYNKADIFLAPSRWAEGFGLPFAEALACGVPVIASDIPSYMSFNDKADYACFVPEGDSSAMAEALRNLIDDSCLRDRLARCGPGVVRNKFDADRVAICLETCFREFLSDE